MSGKLMPLSTPHPLPIGGKEETRLEKTLKINTWSSSKELSFQQVQVVTSEKLSRAFEETFSSDFLFKSLLILLKI
jgi:hypothetical protein